MIPFSSMPRRLAAAVAMSLALAACGGGSSTGSAAQGTKSTVNPKYGEFCVTAAELDAESNATHGNDPPAMSDPAKMKAAWATIMEASRKLYEAAPSPVKSDIKKMLDGMKAMDEIYATYKYNLGEMKAVPKVAEELTSIANNADTAAASKHFKTWMTSNCAM